MILLATNPLRSTGQMALRQGIVMKPASFGVSLKACCKARCGSSWLKPSWEIFRKVLHWRSGIGSLNGVLPPGFFMGFEG
ncbi:hypothetical protein WJX74_010759 [Apatococcus lobatus]|uniref:Uncharacterized protein n=1 Tax=Apatococcus lobatus TaxID=904363 RepID=A0AAW1RLL7_9CHLO